MVLIWQRVGLQLADEFEIRCPHLTVWKRVVSPSNRMRNEYMQFV
jgi:hypothetical protein